MSNNTPVIALKNISKGFGKVIANNNVNLRLYKGEIHALLGENGAGKSTLISIISGVYSPDGGTIELDGKEVHFTSPKEAMDAGVGTIYQHFKLVEAMTARENILLGMKKDYLVKVKKQMQIL